MRSLSSVGLGLSVVFGSLLLALVAELYYLLWWKKRLISKRDIENFFYMFCLKTSSSSSIARSALNSEEVRATSDELQQQSHQFIMELKLEDHRHHHHGMGNQLMGLPKYLFTIVEETKEELECCEEAKSKNKFGSMIINVETPYLTPLASPPFLTPPHTPLTDDAIPRGLKYPLCESTSDVEFNKIRSSPPPKFKFLKEAEEKLNRRVLMEDNNNGFDDDDDDDENSEIMTPPSKYLKDEEDESFITINVDRNKESGFDIEINDQNHHQQQFHSSYPSQVLPLSSSPSTAITTKTKNFMA